MRTAGLVSVAPSVWNQARLDVTWRRESEGLDDQNTALQNWRSVPTLEDGLRDMAPPIRSWNDLRQAAVVRFESLACTEDCFDPLSAVPFARSAAERFLFLLDVLDRMARAFDATGARTAEGDRIYRDYFTGDNALFSDSSDTEKRRFRRALTFLHAEAPGGALFCTWHGKVRHMTLRLHFSWPIGAGEPVYVVYAGPKLTRR